MPIKKAAAKAFRQTKKRTNRNRTLKEKIKRLRREALSAIKIKEAAKAQTVLRAFVKAVDKAAKVSCIHHNTASRLKSRLTKKINVAFSPR